MGSFILGKGYATNRLVSYRAINKKFSTLTNKISKIIQRAETYKINDANFNSSLRTLLRALLKIEEYFVDFLFEKENPNGSMEDDNNEKTSRLEDSMNNSGVFDSSFRMSTNFKTIQLSNSIQNANIGNLLLLNCGHDGSFTAHELEMYSMYLLNSNFNK